MESRAAAKFWRSPEGSTQYDAILRKHMRGLFRAEPLESHDLAVEGLPVGEVHVSRFDDGHVIGVTEGLSGFILDSGHHSCGVRLEFAWVIRSGVWDDKCDAVMAELARRMLEAREPFQEDCIVTDLDLGVWWPSIRARSVMLRTEHYLTSEQCRIDNHFPALIMEIVPLTDVERSLAQADIDGFMHACASTEADSSDLHRTADFAATESLIAAGGSQADSSDAADDAESGTQRPDTSRASSPLPEGLMRDLFASVSLKLSERGCDHSLRFADEWIKRNRLERALLVRWLEKHGGFCDCEVVANARGYWEQSGRD